MPTLFSVLKMFQQFRENFLSALAEVWFGLFGCFLVMI